MLYRSVGTPFGSSPLMLPTVGIRCHEISMGNGIQDINECPIVNQSNYCTCPVRDRLGISCGGTGMHVQIAY